MSSRDDILAAVRAGQPPARQLPAVPLFDAGLPPARARFEAALQRMGGKLATLAPGATLAHLVAERYPLARTVVSATPELAGTRPLAAVRRPHELEDVDLGVVRARFGVAETGSVFFTEDELGHEALAYLAQHLLVLLDPALILPNLHHAYQRAEFGSARYASLTTGPSATADIQGVLIHGAQGVRSLTVLLVAPPAD
jgi:L-lactate dehydrogenase complex protein LldG